MSLDLTKKQDSAYWDKRQESIERQCASRNVAILFQGRGNDRNINENVLKNAFDFFLRLIQNKGE